MNLAKVSIHFIDFTVPHISGSRLLVIPSSQRTSRFPGRGKATARLLDVFATGCRRLDSSASEILDIAVANARFVAAQMRVSVSSHYITESECTSAKGRRRTETERQWKEKLLCDGNNNNFCPSTRPWLFRVAQPPEADCVAGRCRLDEQHQ